MVKNRPLKLTSNCSRSCASVTASSGAAQAGIGEQNVEPAVALPHRLDETIDVAQSTQISLEREAAIAQLSLCCLEPIWIGADHHDPGAFTAKQVCCREADARRAPG